MGDTERFDLQQPLFDTLKSTEKTSSPFGFDKDELQFYPELCTIRSDVDSAQWDCTLLGITVPCVPNYTQEDLEHMGDQLQLMHLFTFIATVSIGLICLRGAINRHGNCDMKHTMAINSGFYAIATGTFALFRYYFGVSRPLAVTGVLHNLFEWAYILQLTEITAMTDNRPKMDILQQRLLFIFCLQILLTSVGIIIPNLSLGFALIQIMGIVMDFGYPILFIYQYWISEDTEVKDFYYLPAVAHFIHLFLTILPLAFTIFVSLSPSWFTLVILEASIHISVPITHFLYAIWSWDKFDINAYAEATKNDDDGEQEPPTEFILPDKYTLPLSRVRKVFGFSLAIAVIFFSSAPKILGPCPSEFERDCPFTEEYTVISNANVEPGFQIGFTNWIASKGLVEKARRIPGNVAYTVLRDYTNHSQYQLISKWDSLGAYDVWKDESASWLESADLRRMLVGGKMKTVGPFAAQPPTCKLRESGAESFVVKSNCANVWKIIKSHNSCFWIPNCDYASVRRTDDPRDGSALMANLEMNDGRILKAKRFISNDIAKVTYEVLESDALMGFSGTLSMTEYTSKNGFCNIHYAFLVSDEGQVSAEYVLDTFRKQIPSLQKFLVGKVRSISERLEELILTLP